MNTLKRSRRSYAEPIMQMRKLVVIGDEACGKTSLLYVFVHNEFPKAYFDTRFDNHDVTVDDKKVSLMLVDTASVYDRLFSLYCQDTDVVLVCFSICDPVSLNNVVNHWKPKVIDTYCKDAPVLLIGTKKDLRENAADTFGRNNTDRTKLGPVKQEDAAKVAERIGALAYLECSARLKQGVNEIFETAARAALRTDKDHRIKSKHKCNVS